jgi:hypothetical protein
MKRRLAGVAVAVALLVSPPASVGADQVTTYTNPVSAAFADTFADPSVIRGRDGAWYAYGTSDPLRSGERTPHRVPIAHSVDLAHWFHAGDAFTDAGLPPYAAPAALLWAPDVRDRPGRPGRCPAGGDRPLRLPAGLPRLIKRLRRPSGPPETARAQNGTYAANAVPQVTRRSDPSSPTTTSHQTRAPVGRREEGPVLTGRWRR